MTRTQVKTANIVSKLLLDTWLIGLAFVLAYYLRVYVPLPRPSVNVGGFLLYLPMMIVQVFSVLTVFYFNKLYHVTRSQSRIDEIYAIFAAVSVGTMIAVAISSLTFKNSIFELDYPRAMVLYAWVLGIVFITLGREGHRRAWHILRMRGVGRDRVLVIGSGEAARVIIQKIQWSSYLGYDLVGVVNGDDGKQDVAGVPVLGSIADLDRLIDELEIEEVIIALPESVDRHELVKIVTKCQRGSVSIKIFPDVFEFITTDISIDDLGGLPLLNVRDVQLRGYQLSLKRGLDIIGASVGLVLLSPFMMLMALLIRLESPGPIFYCQERMGLDGKKFNIIKFRSMVPDAEDKGPGWTTADDPRRTKLGAFLRSKDIDELPQLINVLLGDMSLVGPRPERPVYVEKFRASIPRYMERHREKSGMTGWAQVNGLRGDTSIIERTKYDIWYIENWSVWLDIKIIVRTVFQAWVKSPTERNAY